MKYKSVAAYIRVSGDKQDPTRQREAIELWAKKNGVSGILWFEDSSGRNPRDLAFKRKEFQRLMEFVRRGLVDCIVVDSQDRFGSRDAHQFGSFLTELHEHGCTLVDASGKNLSGRDTATVLTGVVNALTSETEQREKGRRQIEGKTTKARQGVFLGGTPPYGLDVVCFDATGAEVWRTVWYGRDRRCKVWRDGRREDYNGKGNTPPKGLTETLRYRPSIDKARLKIVKQVFAWHTSEAISPKQIADRLNELGVDPIVSPAWYKAIVAAMLRNPVYLGLPAFNKRAGSRFWEFVDGEFREIEGKSKANRRRATSDWIQPTKPEFKPIIDAETWNTSQERLANTRQMPMSAPQTAELWLRPFLYCGHCMKPMHATRGFDRSKSGGGRLWPSYFCGTYNKYGSRNPTGCHCHRVQHAILDRIVTAYVAQTAPKIAQLMRATETGDLELARPLLDALAVSRNGRGGQWLDMLAFVEEKATKRELSKLKAAGADFDQVYGVVYERIRPAIEKQIAAKDAELDTMLDEFRTLSPKLRERANARMEAVQDEIAALKKDVADLRKPWGNLTAEVAARQEAVDRAAAVLSNGATGLRKADALRRVVDRIVCHYRHTQGARNNGKSILDRVEIVPVSGAAVCFSAEAEPGRVAFWKTHFSRHFLPSEIQGIRNELNTADIQSRNS